MRNTYFLVFLLILSFHRNCKSQNDRNLQIKVLELENLGLLFGAFDNCRLDLKVSVGFSVGPAGGNWKTFLNFFTKDVGNSNA